jgi:hypothetical protein
MGAISRGDAPIGDACFARRAAFRRKRGKRLGVQAEVRPMKNGRA